MKCPHCKQNASLTKTIEKWEKDFGDEVNLSIQDQVFIAWYCENCSEFIASVFIEPAETEEVDSPIGPVTVPKLNAKVL